MTHLSGEERARYVQDMFARIARRYDRMNRLMTAGQDRRWRRYVIQLARVPASGKILDIATGTGDIALEGIRRQPDIQAVGGDFTVEMMLAGRRDPERKKILWTAADTLALPFADNTFDAVTSGFLMRNVINVEAAFREQVRVAKAGGRVVVLESSPPKDNLLKPFVRFHLNVIIPALGRIVTGDSTAYRYLPDSTQTFHGPESLASIMVTAGLENVEYRLFMFGTIAVHCGLKSS